MALAGLWFELVSVCVAVLDIAQRPSPLSCGWGQSLTVPQEAQNWVDRLLRQLVGPKLLQALRGLLFCESSGVDCV